MLLANPSTNPKQIAKYKSFLCDGKKESIVINMINIPTALYEPTPNFFLIGIQRLNLRPNKKASTQLIIKPIKFNTDSKDPSPL